MTSPTVFMDERFMLRPEYETRNYDLATDSRTMDFPASGIKIAGTAMTASADELSALDKSTKTTLFDDFLGTFDTNLWSDGEGSNAQANGPVAVASSLSGAVVCESGDGDDANGAVDVSGTCGNSLSWKTNQGGLVMEAKVFVDDITNCSLFVGFVDAVLANGSMKAPIEASGSGDVITAESADAAGIIFDTDFATTPTKFNLGSVKNTAVTTVVAGTTAPTNGAYNTLRVTLTAAGILEGFVDGTSIGTIASAITVTDPLTPCVLVRGRTSVSKFATIDYIFCQQDR